MVCFFFFKQKTAYEVRISDWSSDVCSSDLRGGGAGPRGAEAAQARRERGRHRPEPGQRVARRAARDASGRRCRPRRRALSGQETGSGSLIVLGGLSKKRSEEHTSELQSLMRISYAVFCLKKKNNNIYTAIRHKTI